MRQTTALLVVRRQQKIFAVLRKYSAKKTFKWQKYSAYIFLYFNVDLSKDTDTFGTLMCNCCYSRISNIKARPNLPLTLETARRQGEEGKKVWGMYSERLNASQCPVCRQYKKLTKEVKFIDGKRKRFRALTKESAQLPSSSENPTPPGLLSMELPSLDPLQDVPLTKSPVLNPLCDELSYPPSPTLEQDSIPKACFTISSFEGNTSQDSSAPDPS